MSIIPILLALRLYPYSHNTPNNKHNSEQEQNNEIIDATIYDKTKTIHKGTPEDPYVLGEDGKYY